MKTIQVSPTLAFTVWEPPRKYKDKAKPHVFSSQRLLALANNLHWSEARIIGQGDLPLAPIAVNGWLVMQAHQYSGIIPEEAKTRMKTIQETFIPIRGFLIAEDSRQNITKNPSKAPSSHLPQPTTDSLTETSKSAWRQVGETLLPILGTIVVGAGAAVFSALLYDPLLIACTEDYQWVALYEWWS